MDDQLLARSKEYAAATGRTLTALIEDALREALARADRFDPGERADLPRFDGDGLQPGVDLDDSAALTELMDRSPDPG